MRVQGIVIWVDAPVPPKYQDKCMKYGAGPHEDTSFDISGDELLELAQTYEVAIMHIRHKALAKGAEQVPDDFYIALDKPGKRFTQR